ncbi:MAG: trypsin-like serine protease [Tissierellia bacterium]|nr:trypsin-like serine protease [Tissierellia bacterium]
MSDNNLFDWLNNNDNEDNKNNSNESGFESQETNRFNNINPSSIDSNAGSNERHFSDHEYEFERAKREFYENKEREEKQKEQEKLRGIIQEEVRKSKPKYGFLRALALVLVGSVIGSFIGFGVGKSNDKKQVAISSNNPTSISISANEEVNVENAVAEKSIPSVVGIQVNITRQGGFFGEQILQGEAIGSGVIVSEDGYIITNAHVIADATEDNINILFHNNDKAQAKLIWKDENIDLAIIKTDSTGLTPMELADSDDVKIGDKAIAIGNPVGLNLQSTLTSGYISGTNRSIQMQNGYVMDGLFQTDASINSGNSGGALVNSKGQLIGINTAKVQSTDGIGFAIPVNVAKSIINSVIDKGSFQSVQLGIQGVNLDIYRQRYELDFKVDSTDGVLVMEVVDGGNASRTDIKPKDVIVSIDGVKIESMNKLKQVLLKYSANDKATIDIIRDGKVKQVELTFYPESNA